ncbi:MAG: metallophosphoesterase family protein [Candidatus Hydrogenedentes bacterium]|nr:metallophosphoesterase family protein [Candidatus Hydrogenedentota bacterium]
MFFAVIGDIMSNFSGLEQLLGTLEEEGIQRILHTGNVCNSPEHARECVKLLEEHSVLCVQGKQDRRIVKTKKHKGTDDAAQLLKQTHAALGSIAIEWLNSLPRKRDFTEEGLRIVLCHGAINSASNILSSTTSVERFRRERELDMADIIVCGGARDPFAFSVEQTFFVCPGVMQDEAGNIRYTLVDTESTPWSAKSIVI